ncbi:Ig-like domain-containing protein [Chitinophaga niabensis]|uniref:Ig-like domain-containing protein n=1 Tax=Chitinophaga niabensis TaxID=536979 RepID=A0A1N6JJR5_9BACT|nr:Ig-like domain-containing protein [Chitinophaga niabensis]SIO44565.1 Ig-like domain-containing protein [Chitinophaga niabensis]
MNQNFRGWIGSLIVLALCSFFTQCANIVPPGGGSRDTLAPRLIYVDPADSTLNFNSQRVVFHFNEFVELDNVIEKMIVSPTLKRTPTVTAKLRTITLLVKDSLQPNTTYTFNFGDAVKDVNERNPIEDFQYVVSTGKYLDSLQITGKLIVAETGRVDSNVAVMLYSNLEDSAVSKEKPLYLAKTKGDGSYRFKNLKPGTYRIFALKEEDRDFQYTNKKEMIAFSDELIELKENMANVNMALFSEIDTVKAEEEAPPAEPAPAAKLPKKPKLLAAAELNGGKQELGDSLSLVFSAPLKSLDTARILLLEDTTHKQVAFTLHAADTTSKKFKMAYNWKPGKPYQLILPQGFATDTMGITTLKADTIAFEAKSIDDYGIIKLSLSIGDSAHLVLPADTGYEFVIQLVSNKEIKYQGVINNGKWERGLIQPGEYEIRVLVDENRNGIWDTGVYYGKPKKQPEKVFPYKENLTVKKNWTLSPTVKL